MPQQSNHDPSAFGSGIKPKSISSSGTTLHVRDVWGPYVVDDKGNGREEFYIQIVQKMPAGKLFLIGIDHEDKVRFKAKYPSDSDFSNCIGCVEKNSEDAENDNDLWNKVKECEKTVHKFFYGIVREFCSTIKDCAVARS